jgi:tellurite resistance protein
MLLSLALFFLLVTATLLRQIRRLPFFVSWWAYTFPLDALAIALTLAAGLTGSPVYRLLAQGALGLALLAVVAVLTETVRRIERREICVEE